MFRAFCQVLTQRNICVIQKGAENGIALSEEEEARIDSQINGIKSTYGEDGFTLRARTMGISLPSQYAKMYRKVMAMQKVQAYWQAEAADGTNITADMVNRLDVKAVMTDVVSANNELVNQ